MYRSGFGVFLLAVLLALLAPAGCSSNVNFNGSTTAPIVRVRVLENQDQVILVTRGAATFKSSGERVSRRLDMSAGRTAVVAAADGWHVGNMVFPPGELTIQPSEVGAMTVNGAAYRGQYRFIIVPNASGKFDVVNDVDIDSYLCGVLPGELLSGWNIETYKAQAIAARTYALYEARTSGSGRAFDVNDDQRSQVYKGMSSETYKSKQAVIETSGVVVAYGPEGNEKIFRAYFSSCCGGVGQSAYDAFGYADIPPLRAKNVGTLCSASPRYSWGSVTLSKDELTRRIRAWGTNKNRPEKDIGLIQRIDIAPGAMRSLRPVRFFVTDARNLQYSLSGEELRTACNSAAPEGAVKLNSSYFTPVNTVNAVEFTDGHGWGHGVGMCQWCAEALALQGKSHEDIVRFSYPGAVLVRAY